MFKVLSLIQNMVHLISWFLFGMKLLRSPSPLILGSLAAKAGCSYLGPPKTMSQYFQRRDAILAKTPSPLQPDTKQSKDMGRPENRVGAGRRFHFVHTGSSTPSPVPADNRGTNPK